MGGDIAAVISQNALRREQRRPADVKARAQPFAGLTPEGADDDAEQQQPRRQRANRRRSVAISSSAPQTPPTTETAAIFQKGTPGKPV